MQPRNPDMLVHLLKTKWTGKKYAMNYAQTKSRNTFTKFTGRICIVMALLTAQSALAEPAGKESMIRNAKQILFLGDSITMDGRYVAAVDAWLTARYGANARVAVNAGLSSETVSGLTEEGHADGKFPRPYLHERLGRVLDYVKPDLVFACYGMNCGIYKPFDEERFKKYREGITLLHDAATKAGARIVFITPAMYDNKQTQNGDASYDEVLARYSAWLLSQRATGWNVIDVHGPMVEEVAKQRQAAAPNFTFAPDGVHPDDAGHWFMAKQIIAYFEDADAANATSPELIPEIKPGTLALVKRRLDVRRDATLSVTEHTHPSFPKGPPMDEAQATIAELDRQIAALYSTR